jgi:hypothetical protein
MGRTVVTAWLGSSSGALIPIFAESTLFSLRFLRFSLVFEAIFGIVRGLVCRLTSAGDTLQWNRLPFESKFEAMWLHVIWRVIN